MEDVLSLSYQYSSIDSLRGKEHYYKFISKNSDNIKSSKDYYWKGMNEIKYEKYY